MAVGHGGHHGLDPGGDESAATAAATLTASAAAAADWTAAFQVINTHRLYFLAIATDKNVLVEIMNTIIKRWSDLFLYALLFRFAFRNLP